MSSAWNISHVPKFKEKFFWRILAQLFKAVLLWSIVSGCTIFHYFGYITKCCLMLFLVTCIYNRVKSHFAACDCIISKSFPVISTIFVVSLKQHWIKQQKLQWTDRKLHGKDSRKAVQNVIRHSSYKIFCTWSHNKIYYMYYNYTYFFKVLVILLKKLALTNLESINLRFFPSKSWFMKFRSCCKIDIWEVF